MTESNPFDIFKEASPLHEMPRDSLDEFLDRINEDLVAGAPERITGERLEKLVAAFREEAIQWEIKQKETPTRGKKKTFAESLQIDIQL